MVTFGGVNADCALSLRAADSALLSYKPQNDGPASPLHAIYAYRIPTTGTYYLGVLKGKELVNGALPEYNIGVYLSTATPPPQGPFPGVDYYRFTAAAGTRVSLSTAVLSSPHIGGPFTLAVEDGAGQNVPLTNNGFTAPAAGTYYAKVTGNDSDYYLLVNRDAFIDSSQIDVPTGLGSSKTIYGFAGLAFRVTGRDPGVLGRAVGGADGGRATPTRPGASPAIQTMAWTRC